MLFSASRLRSYDPSDGWNVAQLLLDLGQDVEEIDWSTWKAWQTVQVLSEDGTNSRIYSGHEPSQRLTSIVRQSPCYLRTTQDGDGTSFTLVSGDSVALGSLQALLENAIDPIRTLDVEAFVDNNHELRLQSAETFSDDSGQVDSITYSDGQPVHLRDVLASSRRRVLSISAAVDVVEPLRVKAVAVNLMANRMAFLVDDGTQDEAPLVGRLIELVENAYAGKSFA